MQTFAWHSHGSCGVTPVCVEDLNLPVSDTTGIPQNAVIKNNSLLQKGNVCFEVLHNYGDTVHVKNKLLHILWYCMSLEGVTLISTQKVWGFLILRFVARKCEVNCRDPMPCLNQSHTSNGRSSQVNFVIFQQMINFKISQGLVNSHYSKWSQIEQTITGVQYHQTPCMGCYKIST